MTTKRDDWLTVIDSTPHYSSKDIMLMKSHIDISTMREHIIDIVETIMSYGDTDLRSPSICAMGRCWRYRPETVWVSVEERLS